MNSLSEVEKREMTVIECGFDFRPSGDVSRELHLIRQGQDMIVARDVDVQNMEVVRLAQIVGEVDKTGGCCFGHAIVYHDDVLIEIVFIFGCSRVEQRQKVVCGD